MLREQTAHHWPERIAPEDIGHPDLWRQCRRARAALLDLLCRQAAYPEYQCRFRWEDDSVAFWDNRCCQHLALNDYPGHRRLMHRVQIKGTKPV